MNIIVKFLSYIVLTGLIFLFIFNVSNNLGQGDHIILQSWAEKQIREEFSYFEKNKFEMSDILKTYKDLSSVDTNKIIHFQIIKNKLYSSYSKSENTDFNNAYLAFVDFFNKMLAKHPLEDNVDFLIDVSPVLFINDNIKLNAPLFTASKNTERASSNFLILAPDYTTIDSLPKRYDEVLKSNTEYPWERKLNKAIWHGLIDEGYSRKYWESAPKTKLLKIAEKYPNLLDIKFDIISNDNISLKNQISKRYPFALLSRPEETFKYKITISMETNYGLTNPDFLFSLLSNSVPLKTKSTNVMWFYTLLKDGEDYINIAPDISDVLEKIEWVKDHDNEAKIIAEKGSKNIQKEITPAHLMLYWHKLLETYAKVQKVDINSPTLLPVE